MGAVAVQHRTQRVGELHLDRDVGADIGAVLLERGQVVVTPHARMQRHHQAVVAGHPRHLRNQMATQRGSLHFGDFTLPGRA